MRVAIYSRVSTQGQADAHQVNTTHGAVAVETSLDTQEAACVAYASERGWTVVGTYRDVFTGANLWERPALAALRQQLADRGADVLLSYAQDRLSRDMTHTAIVLDICQRAGATLDFVTEDFDATVVGKFLLQARAFAGELEREKIAERTSRGRASRARAGGYLPGPKVRFGFRWADERRSRMVADPEHAPIVSMIFRLAVKGISLRGIAMRLNEDGVPPPTGRGHGWRHTTIRKIIIDSAYTGRSAAWRKQSVKVHSARTGRDYIGAVPRPVEGQIAYPDGTVERLIDDDTFRAANARLSLNKIESVRRNANPELTLLRAGFARCGYCRRALAVNNRTGRQGQYTCKANSDGTRTCPAAPSMDAMRLDGLVWDRVTQVLTDPSIIAAEVAAQAARRSDDDDGGAAEVARLDAQLAALDAKRRNFAANLGLLDPDSATEVRTMLAALAYERRTVERLRDEQVARQEQHREDRDRLEGLQAWCRRVGANLDTLSYSERRDALTALDATAYVWKVGHVPRYEIALRVGSSGRIVDTSLRAGTRPPGEATS